MFVCVHVCVRVFIRVTGHWESPVCGGGRAPAAASLEARTTPRLKMRFTLGSRDASRCSRLRPAHLSLASAIGVRESTPPLLLLLFLLLLLLLLSLDDGLGGTGDAPDVAFEDFGPPAAVACGRQGYLNVY